MVLIVNLASGCGVKKKNHPSSNICMPDIATRATVLLNSRVASLESRHDCFNTLNFLQGPGSNAKIKDTARNKFNVTFGLFSKVDVNRSDALPLFAYLQKTLHGTLVKQIQVSHTPCMHDSSVIIEPIYV